MEVMYVVNVDTSMSIALEVAERLYRAHDGVKVVIFQKDVGADPENVDIPVHSAGAQSFFDVRGIRNLYHYIVEQAPDVIHVHHTASGLWASVLAKLIGRISVVRTEHNNQRNYSLSQSVVHWFTQAAADRVLCNSKSTYRNLYPLQKWIIGNRWEVVYNGVNVQRIDESSARELPESLDALTGPIIGSVGRLVDQKNYLRLIQGFSSVLEEVPSAHLILVGDGKNRPQLEKEITALGIEDQVLLTGQLPRDDVYAALHRFDLFVMPSLWEGFCNAAVEAMAAGLPVVCSDILTLREVVGDVARYADPKDPEAIARTLLGFLEMSTEERTQWGRKARWRATERYTVKRTAEKYLEAYHAVAGERSP